MAFEENIANLENVMSKFENNKSDLSKIQRIIEILEKLKKTIVDDQFLFLIKPINFINDLLKKINEQNFAVSSATFDFLFEIIYYFKDVMKQLSNARSISVDMSKLISNYNNLVSDSQSSCELKEPKKSEKNAVANNSLSDKVAEKKMENAAFINYNAEISDWDASAHSSILEDFISETEEIIEELSKNLIECEKKPEELEIVNLIFRSMHTLKGNSATLNLKIMNLIAHRAENVLDKIRTNKLKMSSEINDVMLECVDYFQAIIEKIKNHHQPKLDIDNLLNNLDSINNTGKSLNLSTKLKQEDGNDKEASEKKIAEINKELSAAQSSQQSVVAAADSKTENAQPQEKSKEQLAATAVSSTIRIDISKLDKAMNLMGEIVIDKIRLRQKIALLTQLSDLIDRILSENEKYRFSDLDVLFELTINDKLNDFYGNYKISHSKYSFYYDRINELCKLLKDVFKFQNVYNTTDYHSVINNICSELRRINQILKENITELNGLTEHLDLISSELQENIMQMRMIPIQQLYDKIPRIVRSVSRDLKKKVELIMEGGDIELDKTVIEQLNDPFIHLMRNSIDHGIETPDIRKQKVKDETGVIIIRSEHLGNQVLIKIIDDGKGIDETVILKKAIEKDLVKPEQANLLTKSEILNFIFLPGFSSAEKITEVSGRGVGMDVVKSNIRKLKGTIEIDSQKDKGTTISIRLPLTMSVMQVQLIECSNHIFAIPINFIEETLNIKEKEIEKLGRKNVFNLRGEIVSILKLSDLLELTDLLDKTSSVYKVIIIKISDKKFGLIIDKIIAQQDIVLKSLGDILKNMKHISGATILGEGKVVILLDMLEIFETIRKIDNALAMDSFVGKLNISKSSKPKQVEEKKINILVVDDSKTVVANMCEILNTAGYSAEAAYDGIEALEKAKAKKYDLFTVDIMMPKMDGYVLTQKLREMNEYKKVPILMLSSKTEKIDKLRGLDAGADEYMTKPINENELVNIIKKFL